MDRKQDPEKIECVAYDVRGEQMVQTRGEGEGQTTVRLTSNHERSINRIKSVLRKRGGAETMFGDGMLI